MSPAMKRLGLCLVLTLTACPFLLRAGGAQQPKTQFYTGKVVPLAKALEKHGAKLDPDAGPAWLALVADDGKIYPLIKDDGSRMFFKDARLLDRPVRLTARLIPDTHLLQVLNVHSVPKGRLHEVYYWCDICSIRGYEKKICDCCGDLMELREVPAKEK